MRESRAGARPLTLQTTTARLGELVPRAGLNQLVAALEELQRRAACGRRAPRELMIVLEINEQTGTVEAVLVRKRYDWVDM